MLRTPVLEQVPGMALMEVRAKLQTPDVVSRTEVQHKVITLCWGCHQIVCNSCCMSLCMTCPLFGGRHTDFLQRSWSQQLAELPVDAPKTITNAAPKCPTCHRLMCALCDLGLCPGCLKPPPQRLASDLATEPPIDCGSCSRRLCAGCGRCECRRCQPELCRLCLRVRPRRCPVACDGAAITQRSKDLPLLPGEAAAAAAKKQPASKSKAKAKKAGAMATSSANGAPSTVRCPACDRRCSVDFLLVFCCRGKWSPLTGCAHNAASTAAAAGLDGERRLELATCGSQDGETCDTEESSEPAGFAELVPPHCRIFTGKCRPEFR